MCCGTWGCAGLRPCPPARGWGCALGHCPGDQPCPEPGPAAAAPDAAGNGSFSAVLSHRAGPDGLTWSCPAIRVSPLANGERAVSQPLWVTLPGVCSPNTSSPGCCSLGRGWTRTFLQRREEEEEERRLPPLQPGLGVGTAAAWGGGDMGTHGSCLWFLLAASGFLLCAGETGAGFALARVI